MRLALNFQKVDPTRGGAETYVVDLCHRLVRAGHKVDLYVESWREGVLPAEVQCVAVPVLGKNRLARMWSFGKNSETVLAGADYDCTIGFINTWAHDVLIPQGGVHGASLEANSKRFARGWQRGMYRLTKRLNPKFWSYRAIEKKQYSANNPSRVVAVSQMVREHLQRFHHVASRRIHVVPNAIDTARLQVSQPGALRCSFRNQFGIAPDALVALFVGHNFWLKGLKPLLLALSARKRRDPNTRPIHLVVCGGGNLGPFRRMVHSLGLADTVHLIGFYPDIRACYWACDFFVSPTYYDPCSLVVFEALACGLPVITTACNGAGELMTDGREGYVITAPDALSELVSALEHMADDDHRKRMSHYAARLGQEQSMDRHVAKLVRVFEDVAESKSRWTPHQNRQPAAVHRREKIV